ncbi:integrin [Mactra antiquata]
MDLNICAMCSKGVGNLALVIRGQEIKHSRDLGGVVKSNSSKMTKTNTVILVCLIILSFSINDCSGFNIDISSKMEFQGNNDGSYYGFTVAMLNQGPNEKWLLIGAPKDNSTFLPDIDQTGAIHRCTLNSRGHSCEELFVDDAVGTDQAVFDGVTRIFEHGRDGQWLGASLDVSEDAGIVTCASRWYNKRFQDYFMNGLCYELPLDFNSANIEKIPALIDGRKQTITTNNATKLNYGMGSLGSSVHYTHQGSDLLLGAPGLRTWTGGFVDLRGSDSYILGYNKPATENSEMAGYAMTSGNYFGTRYFAIGAPRDNLAGKVFLFRSDQRDYVLEEAALTINGSELIEMPVNGFFGATLCSSDVNSDGFDDLIVAAPFYSKGVKDDTGIVFVYLGSNEMKFKVQRTLLTGSDAAGARFGTSIGSLGDINMDGYNDIVIGAPYENDNEGSIYVYNGCTDGLWSRYSQRITGSSVSSGLTSFGISFSKPVDMNDDYRNDIAVGAYLSDKVFLFYGQYVISLDITVRTSVEQIDKDNSTQCASLDGQSMVPCFTTEVCFFYAERIYSDIDLNVTLKIDTYMGEYNRIMFRNGKSTINLLTRVFSGANMCTKTQDVLIKSTSDLVTPVRIQASYDVVDIAFSGGIKPTINEFDGRNPSKNLLMSSKVVEFKKDCPNNDCRTDLHVYAEPVYDKSYNNYYIMGSPPLAIDVTIKKSGDPSYSSNFFIAFPETLQFQKVEMMYIYDELTEISCGFVFDDNDENNGDDDDTQSLEYLQRQNIPKRADDEILMMCSFGNPMSNDEGVRFRLHLFVPPSVNSPILTFRLNATTLSTELQPEDNVKTITIDVRHKVKTSFIGVSRPSYFTIKEKDTNYIITHVYEMKNQGPSQLPEASLMIQYPQIQQNGKPLLYLNLTSWNCPPPCRISCSYPDTENTAPVVHAANIGPTYVVTDNTGNNNEENIGESRSISNVRNINCEKELCSRYECELYDIPARESAVINLDFVATGKILDATSDGEAITMRSIAYVSLKQLQYLLYDVAEHDTDIGTDLLPVSPPPKSVPWWIYFVSILAGILLIIIVILVLWKCGFFKRKRPEDNMQHTGEVEKMMPENGDDGEVKS